MPYIRACTTTSMQRCRVAEDEQGNRQKQRSSEQWIRRKAEHKQEADQRERAQPEKGDREESRGKSKARKPHPPGASLQAMGKRQH